MRVVLTVTAGPAQGRSYAFEQPDLFLVGRGADAHIALPDDHYLSRHHFLLEISPPNVRINDLDSKNGTFVDGVRYGGRKPPDAGMRQAPDGANSTFLKAGSEIVVGETRIRISVEQSHSEMVTKGGVPTLVSGESKPLRPLYSAQLTVPEVPSPRARASLPTMVDAEAQLAVPPAPPPNVFQDVNFPGYRVESVLGKGGMGIVYKAVQEKTGRPVAIKAMLPQVEVSFQAFQRFHREIEVTRQLRHVNIVELIESGRVKGGYYCVLEYVDGPDLKRYTRGHGGKLTLPQAAPLMIGTLRGLACAHQAQVQLRTAGAAKEFTGIVHRDLKPENILLARQNDGWIPKVADFGLAKSYESAGMTDMTMAGVCGTPVYWPREQLTHYRYLHPATDVFSIAAVFYELLTDHWARPGMLELFQNAERRGVEPQMSDYMRVIGGNPVPPLHELAPDIPIPVADVIDRALHEPEVSSDERQMWETLSRARYRDAGAFGEELALAFQRCGIQY